MSALEYLAHMAEIYDRGPAAFLEHDRTACRICDAHIGIDWWNSLTHAQRADWLEIARRRHPAPSAADAWEAFKASAAEPIQRGA